MQCVDWISILPIQFTNLINEQKKKGAAVIFVGEDLDVLLELSDRILVLCGGESQRYRGWPERRIKIPVGMMMTRIGGSEECRTKGKEPLFHIVKRDALPWHQSLGNPCWQPLQLALIVCANFDNRAYHGINPIQVYVSIFTGAFGTARKTWITFQNVAILAC